MPCVIGRQAIRGVPLLMPEIGGLGVGPDLSRLGHPLRWAFVHAFTVLSPFLHATYLGSDLSHSRYST